MRIDDVVKLMTKQYLNRVLDSFTKDMPKMDEEEAREFIVRNAAELANVERLCQRLDLFDVPHSQRVLVQFVLEIILNAPGYMMSDRELAETVQQQEQSLLDFVASGDALQYADDRSVDIFETVLSVAYEDDEITRDEFQILLKLRQKLGLSRKQHRLIEAKMGFFPKRNRQLHTVSDVNDALNYLQRQGIIFYCNRAEDGCCVVLPEELQPGVKLALNIELSDNAKRLLWTTLPNTMLRSILRLHNLPVSGTKEDMVERLLFAEAKVGESLDLLTSEELYEICSNLPGVKVSGSKQARIERIIAHFDKLLIRDIAEGVEPGELYYEYLVELARRDRENLLANKVIKKDIDIERAFEEGTRYIFINKFLLKTKDMPGTEKPDGCIELPDGSLLMWDNKSKEDTYTFPNSHINQFKRYIRDSIEKRVSCFLVIVPTIADDVDMKCMQLKIESQHDSDVCVISAEDFKWLADAWAERGKNKPLNLNLFKHTGIMTRKRLDQLMHLFA